VRLPGPDDLACRVHPGRRERADRPGAELRGHEACNGIDRCVGLSGDSFRELLAAPLVLPGRGMVQDAFLWKDCG
jgi:hypothetical protein